MDIDQAPPTIPAVTTVDREKTAPFLVRAFVRLGSFHRLSLFEDNTLPTAEEQQIFTWKDATLREMLTSLRTAPGAPPEFKHPLARYTFRAVFADPAARGRFAQKDLGIVYSRDILGEPGSISTQQDEETKKFTTTTAPRLLLEGDEPTRTEDRTLGELRFVPGDYMCIAILLPKSVVLPGNELTIKGSAHQAGNPAGWGTNSTTWKAGDSGWGGNNASSGRGGGHWRGDSSGGRGGRGRGDSHPVRGRAGEILDSRRPRRDSPPRRGDSPPPSRGGWGDRGRGGRGGNGGGGRRSMSRSRSPPRRRRYD